MVSFVEFPLVSLILVSGFAIGALFLSTTYTLATWTSSAVIAAVVMFALWKFSIMPHMTILLPILVMALILGIVADVGFKYYREENDEVPGTTIVASGGILLLGFGYYKGWF